MGIKETLAYNDGFNEKGQGEGGALSLSLYNVDPLKMIFCPFFILPHSHADKGSAEMAHHDIA